MKKAFVLLPILALCCALIAGGASEEALELTVDEAVSYQTIESFGTSGCWWSQYMGLWDMPWQDTGRSVREEIAALLFDRENGIGLTNYRYNLGAGSADSGNGSYADIHRRTQSFETAPGVYDWEKDAGAVWFLQKAVELGVEEVVLFCNSPLERLTMNGTAQMTQGGAIVNIAPENYPAWAVYCCDVAEHFIEMGVPVKYLSPINEPQWDWYAGNQEGSHFEAPKIAGIYTAFLEELQKREKLSGVELSGPESGEWGGKTIRYVNALLSDPVLDSHFTAVDCHSYWSDAQRKNAFMKWMLENHPDKKIRMSEWCEMVNGPDYGMDSALVLALTLAEDLQLLNVVSWSTWVGVAPGDYHDGLIYASENAAGQVSLTALKRLWAYGNYTRFIRPGDTRVEIAGGEALSAVAFRGEDEGKQRLVIVLVNNDSQEKPIRLNGSISAYTSVSVYETSDAHDLEQTAAFSGEASLILAPRSVTTVEFTE